jgi:Ca-activated chloride channel family protein
MPSKKRNVLSFSSPALILFLFLVFVPSAGFAQIRSVSPPPPINIAVIFDLSQSSSDSSDPRQRPRIKPQKYVEALTRLVQLNNQNQYFIISIGTTPTLILNGSSDADAIRHEISRLAFMPHEGATALYDACYLGIEKVTQDERSKRVLLVVSDGMDTLSRKYLNDVRRALIERDVKLYAIVQEHKDKLYKVGAKVLDELASISGGEAFHPNSSEDLSAIIENLIGKLRE